jgi:hypothetical protein
MWRIFFRSLDTAQSNYGRQMNSDDFDYSSLRRELIDAARTSFQAIRNAHPREQFYTFALYSDDGAMTVVPAANTEEGLERARLKYGPAMRDEKDYLRWGTAEWAYEAAAAEPFDAACQRLYKAADDSWEDDDFAAHRLRVFEQMINALDSLQNEGFFGAADERRRITLFCTVSDSDNSQRIERESAVRLNGALPNSPYWQ